jgi:hypothetical protein
MWRGGGPPHVDSVNGQVAAQSQRILLIRWGRPAELEEFLLPPIHGLD